MWSMILKLHASTVRASRKTMKQNRRSSASNGVSQIGDLVPQLITRFGLHRHRNLEQIEEAWRQAVGEQFAEVTRVSKFSRGTLTIKVPHSAFAQELSFRHSELIDALAALVKEETIKKIRFVV